MRSFLWLGETKKGKSIFNTYSFIFYWAIKNTASTGNNKHQKWDILAGVENRHLNRHWHRHQHSNIDRHQHHNLKVKSHRHRNGHQRSKIGRHRHRKAPTSLKQVFLKQNSQPYEPASINWFIIRKFQQTSFF